MASATVVVPAIKRPPGVSLLSGFLLGAAVAFLVLTLMHHVGGLVGIFRLVAVLVMALLAVGLWKLHNGSRVFLFFLFVSDVIGCLMALFLYALRTSHYRLAMALVIQMAIYEAL